MFLFAPIRWALRLPSMLIAGAAVYVVASGVQVVTASRHTVDPSGLQKAAAIVVLPAPLSGAAPSADLTGRLEEALSLSRAGVAPKIVVAGAPLDQRLYHFRLVWSGFDHAMPFWAASGASIVTAGSSPASASSNSSTSPI